MTTVTPPLPIGFSFHVTSSSTRKKKNEAARVPGNSTHEGNCMRKKLRDTFVRRRPRVCLIALQRERERGKERERQRERERERERRREREREREGQGEHRSSTVAEEEK
jgi:hypothetical protein